MQAKLLGFLISQFLRLVTPDLVKMVADMFLDFIEKFVLGTASKVDDAIVLPICKMVRVTFDIPDND